MKPDTEKEAETRAALIRSELATIAERSKDKKLHPEDVVEFAKKRTNSALHASFNWDLKEAAYAHWMQQARQLITVYPIVIRPPKSETVVVHPEYVSLSDSRGKEGGYEHVTAVMQTPERRRVFLADVVRQLSSINGVKLFPDELGEVIAAIDNARKLYGVDTERHVELEPA